jgi:hypothetical protein
MKALSGSLVCGLLAIALLSAYAMAQTQTPKVGADSSQAKAKWATVSNSSKVYKTNSPYLVSACTDAKTRFGLWLSLQAKSNTQARGVKAEVVDPDAQVDVASLLKELGWEAWQANIIWSWGDMGPCEGEVQKEIKRVELETGQPMYEDCIWPGGTFGRVGRACVMQKYACDAARNKFDNFAFEITVATQMHNGDAVTSLRNAGVWKVAEFIRNNRGCR